MEKVFSRLNLGEPNSPFLVSISQLSGEINMRFREDGG